MALFARSRARSWRPWLIAGALIGCGGRSQTRSPTEPDSDAGSMAVPEPDPDRSRSDDTAQATPGGVAGMPDGVAGMPETIEDPVAADPGPLDYDHAAKQILDARNARWVECFNAGLQFLEQPKVDPYLGKVDPIRYFRPSAETGRIGVDPARMAACLARYQNASCDELGRSFPQDSLDFCAGLLVGQVAQGGECYVLEDCADLDHFACHFDPAAPVCENVGHCRPKTVVGDLCDYSAYSCSPGFFCGPTAQCARLSAAGEPCSLFSLPCEDGLGCNPQGVCEADSQPVATPLAGAPCASSGGCLTPYVCLIDSPNTKGTCGPGRKLGEACDDHASDCGYGLRCVGTATGSVCGYGKPIGASCIDGGDLRDPCTLGAYCSHDDVCTAKRPEGAACRQFDECQSPLICGYTTTLGGDGFCVSGPRYVLAVGQSCWELSVNRCVEHTDCSGSLSMPGTCTALPELCAQ